MGQLALPWGAAQSLLVSDLQWDPLEGHHCKAGHVHINIHSHNSNNVQHMNVNTFLLDANIKKSAFVPCNTYVLNTLHIIEINIDMVCVYMFAYAVCVCTILGKNLER